MRMLTSLLLLAATAMAFNVDIPSASTYYGQPRSYFGFSVELHRDLGATWMLVGAPTAQTTQPGVLRGGAVYKCDTNLPGSRCAPVPFDNTGNNKASGKQIDQKSGQWLGATVRSSKPYGPVVACAPRYVWYSGNYTRRQPVGTCFVASESFRQVSEYSPCRRDNEGYNQVGYCQAGFGASMTPDGNRLFIGAVGSWYWQGQVFSQELHSRPDVYFTNESEASEDDSYLGYSTAAGDFDGDGQSDVAVGMPRGANLTGKVVMYTTNLMNIKNVTGDQLGAYFGYCVAASDLNGDGLDDLIIGAPMYTNYANTEGKYETGRVYIAYQKRRDSFQKITLLDGDVTKARFGLAVTKLGDINLDEYNDIAVGAPYGGPNGGGAVYIFHGSAEGIKTKATQVIYGEQISLKLKTFGFSVAGGLDVDGNGYPDFVVGAYESDSAVYFKSRPVVNLDVEINYQSDTKLIDLEKRNCAQSDTPVACVPLWVCFQFDGKGIDNQQNITVQIILDAKKPKNPRLHFISMEGKSSKNETFKLTKGKRECKMHTVYARSLIRDKLTPIEAEVRYSLEEVSEAQRRSQRSLPPVIGTTTPTKSDFLNIMKNCGPDNICVPDMQLDVRMNMKHYILGSDERMEIQVTVFNGAEDAFEATVYLFLPPTVSFIKTERTNDSDTFIICSPPAPGGNNAVRCDIGNPLPERKLAKFTIRLDPNITMLADEHFNLAYSAGGKLESSLEFVVEVNSTNPEADSQLSDNIFELSLPIRVQTDLQISGQSDPSTLRFNMSDFNLPANKTHESHIGPRVNHTYELHNNGPSDVLQAEVYILWPTKTSSGKYGLYLVDYPIIKGLASCQPVDGFNPLRLKLESSYSSSYSSSWQSSVSRSSSSSSSNLGSSSSSTGSSSSSTSYRHSSRNEAGWRKSGNSLDGSVSNSSWNRTSSTTHYNLDGQEPVSRRRYRRQSPNDLSLQKELSDCDQCTVIKCKTAPITTSNPVVFELRSRLWADTMSEIDRKDVSISSKIVVRELSRGGDTSSETSVKTDSVTTKIDLLHLEQEARAIPWWVIVLSAIAGVLLLLLLIFVLWKFGFFERKRPNHDEMENEPLKSHGSNMQRDEAL